LSSRTQIEVYEDGNFTLPKTVINADEKTLGKKGSKSEEEKKSSKQNFWFDGFEFIPTHTTIQSGTQHQYVFAWQNSEGLSEK